MTAFLMACMVTLVCGGDLGQFLALWFIFWLFLFANE